MVPSHLNRPVVPPIFQSVPFEAESVAELQSQVGGNFFYARHGNPTVAHAERLLAELEGAPESVAFGSGMASISTTLLTLLQAGDHLVAQREVYGATFDLVAHWLPRFGVEVTLVDPVSSAAQLTDAIQPHGGVRKIVEG